MRNVTLETILVMGARDSMHGWNNADSSDLVVGIIVPHIAQRSLVVAVWEMVELIARNRTLGHCTSVNKMTRKIDSIPPAPIFTGTVIPHFQRHANMNSDQDKKRPKSMQNFIFW